MSDTASSSRVSDLWDRLGPSILEEWPQLDPDALAAAKDDVDQLVTLIATAADRTRASARHQLDELIRLAEPRRRDLETRLTVLLERLEEGIEPIGKQAREVISEVEARAEGLADEVKAQLPQAEEHMRKNLWTTVFAALGIGLIFGLLWGTSRGR
jgi:ElaB/YqjD/DUF883 family membrane-anchored ribosome-binding protein